VLWTRTVTDLQADFRGVADAQGSLYWVEFTPPQPGLPPGPAWLVSSGANGTERYRARLASYSSNGAFILAGGRVVLSDSAVLSAYDASTGAPAWVLDLSTTYQGETYLSGLADLGDGTIAFVMWDGHGGSGAHVASLSTGGLVWSGSAVRVDVSNAAGSAFLIHDVSQPPPAEGLAASAGVLAINRSGDTLWSSRVADAYPRALLWFGQKPWIALAGASGISPGDDYVAVPANWAWAVLGVDVGFAFSYAGEGMSPDRIGVIVNGAVAAQGPIDGTHGWDDLMTFPFLAGERGDHLVLVSQVWHSVPALCRGQAPGAAAISRFDGATSWQCPLLLQGAWEISGAVLQPGQLVIARREHLDSACGWDRKVEPVTIEAYALPGESLAPAGWVQAHGSPGAGNRPLLP
jgi:hypothetical protein